MRDRLIELLRKSGASFENALPDEIADHLLENGVVVLDKKNSVEDMIELLKAQIAVLQGWGVRKE